MGATVGVGFMISYRALFLTLAAGAVLTACGAKTASPLPVGAGLPSSEEARADGLHSFLMPARP